MFVLTIDSHDPDVIAKHLRALAKDIDGDLTEGGLSYSDVMGNIDDVQYEWEIFEKQEWVPMSKVINVRKLKQ